MRVDLEKDITYVTMSGKVVELRRRDGQNHNESHPYKDDYGQSCPYQDDHGYYYTESGRCMLWSRTHERFLMSGGPGDDLVCSVSDRGKFQFRAADIMAELAASLSNGMSQISDLVAAHASSENEQINQEILKVLRDAYGKAGALCKLTIDSTYKWRQ